MNDLHSLPARKRMGEELGLGKAAPLDTPKKALRRLQKEELVVKLEYGHYQIQDEGFVEWLRQLELEDETCADAMVSTRCCVRRAIRNLPLPFLPQLAWRCLNWSG